MSILSQDGDKISPSHLDVRALAALAEGRMNAYQVARQAEEDAENSTRISNSMIQNCLFRLEKVGLVSKNEKNGFELTWLGKEILRLELKRLEMLVKVGKKRLGVPDLDELHRRATERQQKSA